MSQPLGAPPPFALHQETTVQPAHDALHDYLEAAGLPQVTASSDSQRWGTQAHPARPPCSANSDEWLLGHSWHQGQQGVGQLASQACKGNAVGGIRQQCQLTDQTPLQVDSPCWTSMHSTTLPLPPQPLQLQPQTAPASPLPQPYHQPAASSQPLQQGWQLQEVGQGEPALPCPSAQVTRDATLPTAAEPTASQLQLPQTHPDHVQRTVLQLRYWKAKFQMRQKQRAAAAAAATAAAGPTTPQAGQAMPQQSFSGPTLAPAQFLAAGPTLAPVDTAGVQQQQRQALLRSCYATGGAGPCGKPPRQPSAQPLRRAQLAPLVTATAPAWQLPGSCSGSGSVPSLVPSLRRRQSPLPWPHHSERLGVGNPSCEKAVADACEHGQGRKSKRARVEVKPHGRKRPPSSSPEMRRYIQAMEEENAALRREADRLQGVLRVWATQGFVTLDQALDFLWAGLCQSEGSGGQGQR